MTSRLNNLDTETQAEIRAVIAMAKRYSDTAAIEVGELISLGVSNPLTVGEASALIDKTLARIRQSAKRRGDRATVRALRGNLKEVVLKIIKSRRTTSKQSDASQNGDGETTAKDKKPSFKLQSLHGIPVAPIKPVQVYYGVKVPMMGGFVKTVDLKLWGENDRLRIHLAQFRKMRKREPSPEEVMEIMLTKANLPGLEEQDQFEIKELALSIAESGVRQPPIVDTDGTLLDGNRRIAACYYLLNSDEFDAAQKRRAEWVYVWQLMEHVTDDEREALNVSLNFEPSCKEEWPTYVKAKKVYEAFRSLEALEPRPPGASRQTELRKQLAKNFGYGKDTRQVARYIKMVQLANDFEDYHINVKNQEPFAVQHAAARYIEYFDEIKGTVADAMKDDSFKHLTFDLMLDGKFSSWNKIRDLKYVYQNDEALQELRKARDIKDREDAQEQVEEAIAIARARRAETRSVGGNTRIEVFCKWLNEVPLSAFRDQITAENLARLLKALKLVEGHAKAILEGKGARK